MIQYLDKNNFETTLKNNPVVLVDFYADWCGPCRALHPALEKVAKNFDGQAVISKINVDKDPELSAQLGVRSIPALFYFRDGQLVEKQVGMQTEAAMSEHLSNLLVH